MPVIKSNMNSHRKELPENVSLLRFFDMVDMVAVLVTREEPHQIVYHNLHFSNVINGAGIVAEAKYDSLPFYSLNELFGACLVSPTLQVFDEWMKASPVAPFPRPMLRTRLRCFTSQEDMQRGEHKFVDMHWKVGPLTEEYFSLVGNQSSVASFFTSKDSG